MNTTELRLPRVEVVGELPILWATLERLELPATLGRHFPAPPLWKGPLTPGEVLSLRLLSIVPRATTASTTSPPSPSTTTAPSPPSWARPPSPSTSMTTASPTASPDWPPATPSPDSKATSTARPSASTNSYADVLSERVLLRFGHGKDDPDRPQFEIAAAVLDPLSMPPATAVVPGNTADDPPYVPAIRAVRESLGAGGRSYVDDREMGSLATRAFVAAGGDSYLMNDNYNARPCCPTGKCYQAEHRVAWRLTRSGRLPWPVLPPAPTGRATGGNRAFQLCFDLAFSAPTASVTFPAPSETKSGSAGEQPDEG